jgi:hypothetical protein
MCCFLFRSSNQNFVSIYLCDACFMSHQTHFSEFIIIIIGLFGDRYELWSSSLRSFLRPSVNSCPLGPILLRRILFSNIITLSVHIPGSYPVFRAGTTEYEAGLPTSRPRRQMALRLFGAQQSVHKALLHAVVFHLLCPLRCGNSVLAFSNRRRVLWRLLCEVRAHARTEPMCDWGKNYGGKENAEKRNLSVFT